MSRMRWTVAALLLVAAGVAVAVLTTHGGGGVPSADAPRGAVPLEHAPPGLAARPGEPTREKPASGHVPAPIPESGWRLEGRVLDPQGQAVPGATVVATLWRGNVGTLLPSAASAVDGAYGVDLEAVRRLRPIGRQGAEVTVVASARGYAPCEQEALAEWPEDAATPARILRDLSLRAGDVVTGRVVREDRRPVARAEVTCCDGEGKVGETAAYSGPDGRFSIARPAGTGWRLVAWSWDVGAGTARIDPDPEAGDVGDVVLNPTPRVEGRVVYADGQPVREAWLRGHLEAGPAGVADRCLSQRWFQGRARTGNDGSFAIFLPGDGRCRISLADAAAETQASTGDRDAKIVVTQHRVRVRVLDETGEDIAGLGWSLIEWLPPNAGRLDDLLTGRIGPGEARRQADGFAAGTSSGAVADLFAPGGSAFAFAVHPRGSVPGEVGMRVPGTGNESEVVLRLAPASGGVRLTVRLVDEEGTRVEHAYVSAETPIGSDLWRGILADDAVIGPLRPGRVLLSARPTRGGKDEGWVPPADSWLLPATAIVDVVDGGAAEATLRMRFGGRIRILLRSPLGQPPSTANYGMRAVPTLGGGTAHPMMYEEKPGQKHPDRMSTILQADRPHVTAEPIPPGDYRVEVIVSGAGWNSPTVSGSVRVRPRDVVDLTLDLPPAK